MSQVSSRVIALSGFSYTGKTFLARRIQDQARAYGISVAILSFTAPLIDAFTRHKGIGLDTYSLLESFYKQELEAFSKKLKSDHCNGLYFSQQVMNTIQPYGYYVVDDVHSIDEEIRPILAHKGVVYRLQSPINARIKRGLAPDDLDSDASAREAELDLPEEIYKAWGGSFIYNNSDDINLLNKEATKIIRKHYLGFLSRL